MGRHRKYNAELTKREKEFCNHIVQAEGRINFKELAELMYVAETTLRTHLHNIYSKLLVNSQSELVYKLCNGEEKKNDD